MEYDHWFLDKVTPSEFRLAAFSVLVEMLNFTDQMLGMFLSSYKEELSAVAYKANLFYSCNQLL